MIEINATYLHKTEFGWYLRAGEDFREWLWHLNRVLPNPATLFLRISRNRANRGGDAMALCYASICRPAGYWRSDDPLIFRYTDTAKQYSTPSLDTPLPAPLDARPSWQRIQPYNRQAPRLYHGIMSTPCELRRYLPHPDPHPYPPPPEIDHPEDDDTH